MHNIGTGANIFQAPDGYRMDCMAQLLVRDLDSAVINRLKARARLNHRSLQGEVKTILEEASARPTREEALAIIDKWRERWGDRVFSESAALIRKDRER